MPKTLQETKAGLRCCVGYIPPCTGCPYCETPSCIDVLAADALYWLEELEGRNAEKAT